MNRFVLSLVSLLATAALFSSISPAYAADDVVSAEDQIRDRLLNARPDIPILDIKPAAIPGFYDVFLPAGQVLHFTGDGKHFYTGDLYAVTDQLVNVTEVSRATARKDVLDELDESDMIVFSPAKQRVKATVTVFTDIDCVFCRKLHDEVPELNRLGVAVRYLAYPRSGANTPSYDKLVSAWCAENPQIALTRSKAGQEIPDATCANPVAAQFELGGRLGVNSTPSLIFEDGTLSPGYLPAADLARALGVL